MRSGSVKALSRGGDLRQRAIQYLGGKLHEIRYFSPDQRGADKSIRIEFLEHRAVERELVNVSWRYIGDFPWCRPVRLEVSDQYSGLRY